MARAEADGFSIRNPQPPSADLDRALKSYVSGRKHSGYLWDDARRASHLPESQVSEWFEPKLEGYLQQTPLARSLVRISIARFV